MPITSSTDNVQSFLVLAEIRCVSLHSKRRAERVNVTIRMLLHCSIQEMKADLDKVYGDLTILLLQDGQHVLKTVESQLKITLVMDVL